MANANVSRFRKKSVSAAELQTKFNKNNRNKDDRFWYPERDSSGNASTVIRFLPSADGETLFQTYYDHYFQGDNGWYIDKCRTTIGEECPVCESNKEYWGKAGGQRDGVPEAVQKRSRRVHYVANILVLKDPVNPENEGKVFLFKFKNSIMNMIKGAISPEFVDEEAIQPFDLWNGANFNFKIYKKSGQVSYDKSSFASPSALYDDAEEKIGNVIDKLIGLEEFTYEKEMQSYDQQLVRFNKVTGEGQIAEPSPSAQREAMAPKQEQPAQQRVEEEYDATNDIGTEAPASDDVDLDSYDKYFD